jgi:hypothetical protein
MTRTGTQLATTLAATLALAGASALSMPAPSGLVNSWSGANAAVNAVGTDNGVMSGGVTFVPDMLGRAFQFNGRDSRIDFGPAAGRVGTGDFTIEYWMNTSSSPFSGVEDFLNNRAACGMGVFLDITVGHGNPPAPGLPNLWLRNNGVGDCSLSGANKCNDGQWHHVAWERRADPGGSTCTLLLYLDGALDGSASNMPITDINTTTDLVMGQDPCTGPGLGGRSPYAGAADELEIWNRALSAGEIADIYHDGLAGKLPEANKDVTVYSLKSWFLWLYAAAIALVGTICVLLVVRFARESKVR